MPSVPATGAGTVLAQDAVPAAPPVDQSGATVEFRDHTGQVVIEAVQGQLLTVVAGGFAPHSYVDVFPYSTPQHLGRGLTNAAGTAEFQVTVPADLSVGSHTLAAFGLNRSGATASTSTGPGAGGSPAPAGSDAGGDLASTGSDAGAMLLLGGVLLAAGLGVLTVRARRRVVPETVADRTRPWRIQE